MAKKQKKNPFVYPDQRPRMWRRVMVRLSFLGMEPKDLTERIHADVIEEMTSSDGNLTPEGKKRMKMLNIHFHQKMNGVRNYSEEYLSQIESALGLQEGCLMRGRWVDLVASDRR